MIAQWLNIITWTLHHTWTSMLNTFCPLRKFVRTRFMD